MRKNDQLRSRKAARWRRRKEAHPAKTNPVLREQRRILNAMSSPKFRQSFTKFAANQMGRLLG